jgi:ABC-2 type transport system permease protein
VNKIKKLFQTADQKRDHIVSALIAIVLGIIMVFNLLVGQIPEENAPVPTSAIPTFYEYFFKDVRSWQRTWRMMLLFYILATKDDTDSRIPTFVNKYASMSRRSMWNGSTAVRSSFDSDKI